MCTDQKAIAACSYVSGSHRSGKQTQERARVTENDPQKGEGSRNVFNRLGRDANMKDTINRLCEQDQA